jgi:hypothetical protein
MVFLWSRFTGPNNLLTHPDYAPVFSLRRYLESTAHYLNELSAHAVWTPETAGVLLGALAAGAVLFRSRTLVLAWFLVVLGAAPMAFVSPRGLSAYYIPVMGYAIFIAVGLVRARELLMRSEQHPVATFASRAILFVALFTGLWRWQASTERTFPDHWADLQRIESAAEQFRSHPEWFRRNSSLLIADDPFGEYEWATTFIATVVGNERTVSVHKRRRDQPVPGPDELRNFTNVIGFKDGRYFEMERSIVRP